MTDYSQWGGQNAKLLGELLAVIHGDGGHYQNEHGTEKAVEDARSEWYKLKADNERLRDLVKRLVDVNSPWDEEDGVSPVVCFYCGHEWQTHYDDCPFIEARAALEGGE